MSEDEKRIALHGMDFKSNLFEKVLLELMTSNYNHGYLLSA